MSIEINADSKWICEHKINNINNAIKWYDHRKYLNHALEWENVRKMMWYFKFCVVLTSCTTNCEIEKILFKFEKIDDCIIALIAAKECFCYEKTMTSKIRHQKNKTFEMKYEQKWTVMSRSRNLCFKWLCYEEKNF